MVAREAIIGINKAAPAVLLINSPEKIVTATTTKIITKKETHTTSRTMDAAKAESALVLKVIDNAKQYEGVRYKYAGTTRKGMDCSGLIYTAFKEADISLPRVSRDMANEGRAISLDEVQKGDLLFFQTSKGSKRINHVGLVTEAENDIKFIHSTSSKGVITSKLSEPYWKNAYLKAKRIL